VRLLEAGGQFLVCCSLLFLHVVLADWTDQSATSGTCFVSVLLTPSGRGRRLTASPSLIHPLEPLFTRWVERYPPPKHSPRQAASQAACNG